MFEHPVQINRNNVDAFARYINVHFCHTSYRWDKLSNNVQISHALYASTDCDYIAESGVYYDTNKHAPCNAFNGDVLSGKVYRLLMGKDNLLGILIGERNILYFLMLDSSYVSDMKMVDCACRKLSTDYNTPLIRVNLNLSSRSLLQAYATNFLDTPYENFPFDELSKTASTTHCVVRQTQIKKWENKPIPPYTKPMFKRLTELNRILHKCGHSFEIRVN